MAKPQIAPSPRSGATQPVKQPQPPLMPAASRRRTGGKLAMLTAVFSGGLALGWAGHAHQHGAVTVAQAPVQPQLLRRPRLGMVHPLLACESAADDPATQGLRAEVQRLIAAAQAAGQASAVSVVYQDLEACRGFSIDAPRVFRPASLLKLPLAMAVLQRASRDAGFLERQLRFAGPTQREDSGPHSLAIGQPYTVRELLGRMIRWSRNDAKALLAEVVGQSELRSVYQALAVPWPFGSETEDAAMSAQSVARILRTLYDAAWLDASASDQLLHLLAESEHRAALPSGVPAGVAVSHKWGHRLVAGQPASHQFHDCGIVHLPSRPLLLCVMTAGPQEAELHALIGRIAKAVVR